MAVKKSKAKEWFSIIAPEYFDRRELGRTMTVDPKTLIGRRITVSAIELTNNFSKYYLKLIFRVSEINGNRALTEFDGSECLRDYLYRMVLRRVRRIDTVQDLTTKDGKNIRVKGLAVVSRRAKSSIQGTIRENIMTMLKSLVENLSLEEFVRKIMTDEIKNRVLQESRNIYPVRNFEIRKTEMIR